MEQEFINILTKMVEDRGIETLRDTKLTKALIMDYSHGEYKDETNFLLRVLELDVYKKIIISEDLSITKKIIVKQLCEKLFIADKMANSIVDILIKILRNEIVTEKIYEDTNKIATKNEVKLDVPYIKTNTVFVNEEEGKKRVMNNAKLYAKLLLKFKTDTTFDKFITVVNRQNWEEALSTIHAIRGIAGNLCLVELLNQALDIENQVKGKSVKLDSLENIKACYAETIKSVEIVINKFI